MRRGGGGIAGGAGASRHDNTTRLERQTLNCGAEEEHAVTAALSYYSWTLLCALTPVALLPSTPGRF